MTALPRCRCRVRRYLTQGMKPGPVLYLQEYQVRGPGIKHSLEWSDLGSRAGCRMPTQLLGLKSDAKPADRKRRRQTAASRWTPGFVVGSPINDAFVVAQTIRYVARAAVRLDYSTICPATRPDTRPSGPLSASPPIFVQARDMHPTSA